MKIVLDAGHGYHTPGKRTPDGSMREWEFNSRVADIAKKMLEEYEGVQVQFTHDPKGAIDIPLGKRTYYANNWGADVLVSIHANAAGEEWSSAEGIETYVYTNPSKESLELAQLVQRNLIKETGLKDRGVKKGNLHMVRETKMPAVLAECGFMTNKKEAELLKSDTYRIKCAVAIVNALVEFCKLRPKRGRVNTMSIQLTPSQQRAKELLVKHGILAADYEIKHDYEITLMSMMSQLVKALEKNGALK
jgi:N-acetylmuramoyl-L-alanine amidase